MTLRQKFIVAFAAVAVLVAALVGSFSYIIAARNLHLEVDRSLAAAAATLSSDRDASANTGARAGGSGTWTWGNEGIIQTARTNAADGSVTRILGPDAGIPISADDQALAAANAASGSILFENATVGDTSFRVLTQSLGDGKGAIQVARELGETSRVLGALAGTTLLVGLGVLLASSLLLLIFSLLPTGIGVVFLHGFGDNGEVLLVNFGFAGDDRSNGA